MESKDKNLYVKLHFCKFSKKNLQTLKLIFNDGF